MEAGSLRFLRGITFALLCLWFLFLVISVNSLLARLRETNPGLPFGISFVKGEILAQDFAYNRLFFEGIADRLVAHPYRFADQEQLIRQLLPGMRGGMTHAYSPVALVLTLPLLHISGAHAYLIYTVVGAIGMLLVAYFSLLPRATHSLQLYALFISMISIWVMTTFTLGQSAVITIPLLGILWALLCRREGSAPSLLMDVTLAILFWALCFKPSVAIVPAMLLLGAGAGRVLLLAAALLVLTWIFTAPYYGGWWGGFWDYLYLLNHYTNAAFPAFLQRGQQTLSEQHRTAFFFSLYRLLILISSLGLVVLRWARRISASEQFQGTVWAFLLFSPYLLPTESWILCLLVVEGTFFQSENRLLVYGKLLLLAAILNFRGDVIPYQLMELPLKQILFLWIAGEWFFNRRGNDHQTELSNPLLVLK